MSELKSWAGNYFGRIYGELYRNHLMPPVRAKQEVAFATKALSLHGLRVLDLAAGYGRHARLLAAGNTVTAIDNNPDYLQQVTRGLKGKARRNLNVVQGDMRMLPFATGSFDAVVLLFNSFGYFADGVSGQSPRPTDQIWRLPSVFYDRKLVGSEFGKQPNQSAQQEELGKPVQTLSSEDANVLVLKEIARVLRRRGGLLLETPNPKPLVTAIIKNPRRHVITPDYEIEEEFEWDTVARILRNKTRFRMGRQLEEGEYQMRVYDQKEIKTMLKLAGFHKISLFGSYDGEKYTTGGSDIMLWRCFRR